MPDQATRPVGLRGGGTLACAEIVVPGGSWAVVFSPRRLKTEKPRVEAAVGVEAENAPPPTWKPQTGFHKLPHASSFQLEGVSFSVGTGSKDPVA